MVVVQKPYTENIYLHILCQEHKNIEHLSYASLQKSHGKYLIAIIRQILAVK